MLPSDYNLGEMLGSIKTTVEGTHAAVKALNEKVEKQEERIRILENWRWWLAGGISLAGIGSFASIAKAVDFFK